MTDNVLERLNDWHIDIVKHDVDWGRLVIDAKNEIERLRAEVEQLLEDLHNLAEEYRW